MEERNYYQEIRNIENDVIEHIVMLFGDYDVKQIRLEKEVIVVHTQFDVTISPISIFRVDNHELYAIDVNGNKIHSSYIISSFFAEMFPIIKETIIKRNDRIIEQRKKLNENKKTKKICFLPIKYNSNDLCDIDFYEKALEWFLKAAEQDHPGAINEVGVYYHNQKNMRGKHTEAIKWYKRAAELGELHAQCNLGSCYKYGTGVEKNLNEAAKWYRKAALQKHPSALNRLRQVILQMRNTNRK